MIDFFYYSSWMEIKRAGKEKRGGTGSGKHLHNIPGNRLGNMKWKVKDSMTVPKVRMPCSRYLLPFLGNLDISRRRTHLGIIHSMESSTFHAPLPATPQMLHANHLNSFLCSAICYAS